MYMYQDFEIGGATSFGENVNCNHLMYRQSTSSLISIAEGQKELRGGRPGTKVWEGVCGPPYAPDAVTGVC